MAALLIESTELIEVIAPPVLLYGEPGSGKSSLAQSADDPLTLDFDDGAHRTPFRKRVIRFTTWADVVDAWVNGIRGPSGDLVLAPKFGRHTTIVADTVGRMLDLMTPAVLEMNAKHGTRMGGLSQTGWGVLKSSFDQFRAQLKAAGKHFIMVAHERAEKDGDDKKLRPAIVGGSYDIVMQAADIVGYVSYRNNVRHLGFEPTDRYFAKNGGRLPSAPIPDLAARPRYLAELIEQAKENLGKTAEASTAAARVVEDWKAKLAADPNLDALNALIAGPYQALTGVVRAQVWREIVLATQPHGLVFNRPAGKFELKPEAAAKEGAAV